MKIGIDFGGVVDWNPDGWAESIKLAHNNGHEVFLISHALPGKDHQKRIDFAKKAGCVDYTFSDISHEPDIIQRKFDLVKSLGIELFIDDGPDRAIYIRRHNPGCGILCFDNLKQGATKELFDKIIS